MKNNELQKKTTFFSVAISEIRGKKKQCEICKRDFSMLIKEHQCKRCKRAVCFSCSQSKAPVYKLKKFIREPHRICSICKSESEFLENFIKTNKLMFGKDTISAQWLQSLNNKQTYSEITQEYFSYLNDPQFDLKFQQDKLTYQNYKKLDSNFDTFYDDLIDDFNYSIQEFLYKVIGQTDHNTIQTQIRNIMKAFLNKHPDVGFKNELVMITMFFLCFSSEPIAFTIMSKFYELIYPSQLYFKQVERKGEIDSYISLIKQLVQVQSPGVPSSVLRNISQYLNSDFLRIVLQLSINVLTIDNTYLLIDNAIKANSFIELVKGIAAIIVLRIEEIKNFTDGSIEQIQVQLLRNIEYEKFQKEIDRFKNLDEKTQEMILSFSHQQEQEKVAVDERFIQQKVQETPQYKELLNQYHEMEDSNSILKQQLKLSQTIQNSLVKEVEELKKQTISLNQLKGENFELKSQIEDLKKQNQEQTKFDDNDTDLLKKQIKLQQLQIEQLKYESKSRGEELEKISKDIKQIQTEKVQQDTLVENLMFENQTFQYEIDTNRGGRQRLGGYSATTDTSKDSEAVNKQLKRSSDRLLEQEKKMEQLSMENSEIKMQLIRNGRLLQESEYAQKTLEMQVDVFQTQMQKLKENTTKEKKINEEKLSKAYRKMYESLEVVHNKNDELKNEIAKLSLELTETQQIVNDQKEQIKNLQQENQKLLNENEQLSKTSKLTSKKKQNNEDILQEFNYLLNDENSQTSRAIKNLFQRIKVIQQEIQFKALDSQIKREYIINLRSKLQQRNQEVTELQTELDKQKEKYQIEFEQDENPVQGKKQKKMSRELNRHNSTIETFQSTNGHVNNDQQHSETQQRSTTIGGEKGDCQIM